MYALCFFMACTNRMGYQHANGPPIPPNLRLDSSLHANEIAPAIVVIWLHHFPHFRGRGLYTNAYTVVLNSRYRACKAGNRHEDQSDRL